MNFVSGNWPGNLSIKSDFSGKQSTSLFFTPGDTEHCSKTNKKKNLYSLPQKTPNQNTLPPAVLDHSGVVPSLQLEFSEQEWRITKYCEVIEPHRKGGNN